MLSRLPRDDARKLVLGLQGRKEAATRLLETPRDFSRPLIWFHAPSTGEAQQALAVAQAFRELDPCLQVICTHFSPSARGTFQDPGLNRADYLPWDLPEEIAPVLDQLRPELVVFTRTEVWPTLAGEAQARDLPTALIAATVPEGAGRLRPTARRLLRPAWKSLSLACAVGRPDMERLVELGVAPERVEITGDPAVDGAAERVRKVGQMTPSLALIRDRRVLVAGSTWPSDETMLVQALKELVPVIDELLTVFVPHEPSRKRVTVIRRHLNGAGIASITLREALKAGRLAPSVGALVVDRVGELVGFYTKGDLAYVGGGFGRRGLHSVVEPAAAGVPIVFGPRHQRAPAAADLMACGAGFSVNGAVELGAVLLRFLRREDARRAAGRAALRYINRACGADRRTAWKLHRLLQEPAPSPSRGLGALVGSGQSVAQKP